MQQYLYFNEMISVELIEIFKGVIWQNFLKQSKHNVLFTQQNASVYLPKQLAILTVSILHSGVTGVNTLAWEPG